MVRQRSKVDDGESGRGFVRSGLGSGQVTFELHGSFSGQEKEGHVHDLKIQSNDHVTYTTCMNYEL